MSLLRTLRTIRHLRPQQITGQLVSRLRPLWERPEAFALRPAPQFPAYAWRPGRDFLAPGAQKNSQDDLLAGRVEFLNRRESGQTWPPDWNRSDAPKLYLYNLHYFEFLWALDYAHAREAALDWIARHDLRRGTRVGWEPYPISLRLMNWCAVFFGKFREETLGDAGFLEQLWPSLFLQTEWLRRHLETRLMGNHLLENAAALAFVGSCFDGETASGWFETGRRLLANEIREQIPPDGIHYELSPMYHARVAYLMLLLEQTGDVLLKDLVREPCARMTTAMGLLHHPDGQIALLNDSAMGVYNDPLELIAVAGGANQHDEPFAFPDAGYYGMRQADGAYLICDAGRIGPDYIPGHAHGDIFSFELSLAGHRVIVDAGVHDYETSEERRYCRSTRAHNTVEIDGQDQCEFWGAFRVARRGEPHDARFDTNPDGGFRLKAWHHAYRRLRGAPIHEREFVWNPPGELRVVDVIESRAPVLAISRLHFHPDCQPPRFRDDGADITFPGGAIRVSWPKDAAKPEIEESYYCPEFGKKIPNFALAFRASGSRLRMEYKIEKI